MPRERFDDSEDFLREDRQFEDLLPSEDEDDLEDTNPQDLLVDEDYFPTDDDRDIDVEVTVVDRLRY